MSDLSADEIAGLILDYVLANNSKNKEELLPTVRTLLVKLINERKNKPKFTNKKQEAQLRSATQKNLEQLFWKNKTRFFAPNRMDDFYNELHDILIENGFEFKNK